MATTKFLDLTGLQLVVDKIKTYAGEQAGKVKTTSAEYDNLGNIAFTRGDSSTYSVNIPLASGLTGTQSGLLTKAEYDALTNRVEYVGTKVGSEVVVAAPLQKVGDYNNVAVIEILSAITATENSKAVTGKAVADYVAAEILKNTNSDKEYVDGQISALSSALTASYQAADNALSEALTNAYTSAIATSAANIKAAYEAADSAITASYTELVSKTKEALEAKISTDISTAINNLDVEDSAIDGQYVSAVSEADGKISVSRKALPVYTLVKDKTSVNGYKYHLAVDGVQSGDAIDIKDMVVSGGSVSTRDGKTYLDLTIANGETVSIPADSLVDTYKAAEGEDRIVVNGYTISLNQAKLVEDLVADATMLAKYATVENLGKANTAITELTTKHNNFETTVANTYSTKAETISSLGEAITTSGSFTVTNGYTAVITPKLANGSNGQTLSINLIDESDINSMF